jgi:hypothetical protein
MTRPKKKPRAEQPPPGGKKTYEPDPKPGPKPKK